MDKSGVIYMSIPFHRRITRQNLSKNERAIPKGSKIPLLGLTPKDTKNFKIRNEHPTSFYHIFQGKKELFKLDHQKYAFGRGRPGSRSTHSCVRTCICIHKHFSSNSKKQDIPATP